LIGVAGIQDFDPVRVVIILISELTSVRRGHFGEDELSLGTRGHPKQERGDQQSDFHRLKFSALPR